MLFDETLGPKFLLYHDLLEKSGGDAARARQSFRAQIEQMLSSGHRIVSMRDFVGPLAAANPGPGASLAGAGGAPMRHGAGAMAARSVGGLGRRDLIITFDDGASSFIECALPVLREFNVTATVYFVTGFSGRVGRWGKFLTWDEAARLQDEGMDVSCHTINHLVLNEIGEPDMREEIMASTKEMRARGFECSTFAYPFGRCDDAVKATLSECGYKAAFTVMNGGNDIYEIRRRLLTGMEGAANLRFLLSDYFFTLRDALRRPVPDRFLRQEKPIPKERWGPQGFGITT